MPFVRRLALLVLFAVPLAQAQDRLAGMPRYDRLERVRREMSGSVVRGEVSPNWVDAKTMSYTWQGKSYKVDLATGKITEGEAAVLNAADPQQGRNRGTPARGRQFDTAFSPDGALKSFHRDRNVYISKADGGDEIAVTTEGSAEKRTKFGIASWVYGEELGVREAMWWSPDGKKLAYYGFDESKVPDYYLAMNVTRVQDALDVEAYPKAGAPNPVVTLFVCDLAAKKSVEVDTKFGDPETGHYVYAVRWSPDGSELLFNRTNRKQNVMEFCAYDPATAKSRVVVREEWRKSWTDNSPDIRWLADKKQFVWQSERNGYQNYYLGNIDGRPLTPITQHNFEVGGIVRLDEASRTLWYMARDGENPYRMQLHRVGFDGKGEKRLTDPKFHHTVNLSPDGKYFTDIFETLDTPPTTQLCNADGKPIATLAKSNLDKFNALGLQKVERFKFKAADGTTDCYGTLMKPSDFDPTKKYPVVVDVYGGPESGGGSDRFQMPNAYTELGFLIVWIDGRGTSGRGKAHKDAVYGKLGIVEIDDQAAGVKALAQRPYVDGGRVGINGTSYGGYSSAMAILRYPDVFHAAVASSAVTQWANYDTIYTERYMGLPSEGENKEGYEAGSAMKFAKDLKGKLMLFYGTADNNVHPANTYQLVQALQRAGKSFDLMVGPDQGHSGINGIRMWEYFMDNLVLNPPKPPVNR